MKLLTIGEAAIKLNLKPETVREQLEAGEISGVKHREIWTISASAVGIAKRRAEREERRRPGWEPRRVPKWIRPALD